MEWSLDNGGSENWKELPLFHIDTLFGFEERIREISRGHLFKNTVIDFESVYSRWGGDTHG
jgi:hypothetical protein